MDQSFSFMYYSKLIQAPANKLCPEWLFVYRKTLSTPKRLPFRMKYNSALCCLKLFEADCFLKAAVYRGPRNIKVEDVPEPHV
jgi:hypothetical protein